MTMEGTTEKDCSPLWNLYQQIVSDMKVGHVWRAFHCRIDSLSWYLHRRVAPMPIRNRPGKALT